MERGNKILEKQINKVKIEGQIFDLSLLDIKCIDTLILAITVATYSETAVNCGYRELNFILVSTVRNC